MGRDRDLPVDVNIAEDYERLERSRGRLDRALTSARDTMDQIYNAAKDADHWEAAREAAEIMRAACRLISAAKVNLAFDWNRWLDGHEHELSVARRI